MFAFLWLILFAYSSLLSAAASQGKNIILLAGQSNMSGRGGVVNNTWDGVVPLKCRPNPSILRLSARLTWVEAHEPLHNDIDVNVTCGIGPGLVFAKWLLDKDSNHGVVALVPCAVGGRHGTTISEWSRGTYLYNQLVRRARAALQGGGMIRALLWYQGESDTVDRADAELYKGRLEKFFVDLRADLLSPMLPVFQVALASGQGPYIEIVRKAQLGIKLPHVRYVDAKGLKLQSDNLHLSTSAQVRLGKMLALAFLKIQSSAP